MSNSPAVLGNIGGWEITGIVIGSVLAIIVLFNVKDIIRYIKISSM